MTGGEHSGRDLGHDDGSYPSYYGQDEGYQEHPWAAGTRWAEPEGAAPAEGYRGYENYQDYGAGGYAAYPDRTYPDRTYPGQDGSHGYGHGGSPSATGREYGVRDAWEAPGSANRSPFGDRPVGMEGDAVTDGSRRRRGMPLWQELPLLLIIAFCLAILVRTFLLQAFYIPSGSMEDTLLAGDRVLVNKIVYQFREPARGEIVVFRAEAWSSQEIADDDVGALARVGRAIGDLVGISRPGEKDYIKRIIGLPGDRVSCCDVDGRVFVNGQPLDEAYVLYNAPRGESPEGARDCRNRDFDEVVVQPGYMFVMGDHRAVSQDSRCQGQVLIDDIIGRADLIMWPSDRWARLRAPEAFDSVPVAAPVTGGPTLPERSETTLVLPMLLSLAAVRSVRAPAAGDRAAGGRANGGRANGIPPSAAT